MEAGQSFIYSQVLYKNLSFVLPQSFVYTTKNLYDYFPFYTLNNVRYA